MDILFFLIIIGVIIFAIYKYNQKAEEENRVQEQIRKQKTYEEEQKKAVKEIINSERFKKDVKFLNDITRCFNLAGGLDPFLPSLLKYGDKKNEIIIEKQGYDLLTANLNEYYNNPAPQCYEALNRFAVDLFGEYADEMQNFISMEFIADHLIELDNINDYDTDFVLRYTLTVSCDPKWNYNGNIRALYIQEYKKLNTHN